MMSNPADQNAGPPVAQGSESPVHESSGDGQAQLQPLPIDWTSPQLTIRALATGMILGGVLSICNVYTGLKIGWGTNMSITGILLAYAAWAAVRAGTGNRMKPFSILENNINQASCSAAAAVSSAGLVAPIPALTLITGEELSWTMLSIWVFSVCLVGISVATGLRRQMIIVDRLPFPSGIACAATLREIYAQGSEATVRVAMMGVAALVASLTKVAQIIGWLRAEYAIPGLMIGGVPASRYTLSLEPNLLMVGVGGLIGFKAGLSMLLGAILAWGVIAPRIVESGAAALRSRETLLHMPAEVRLEPRDRMEFLAGRGELVLAGQMSDEKFQRLHAMSDDPLWREALRKLRLEANHRFSGAAGTPGDYTTTRAIRRSADLSPFPQGFAIPAMAAALVRYEPLEARLIAWGQVPDDVRDGITTAMATFLEQHPERADSGQALANAVRTLASASPAPLTEPLPPVLAERISIINGGTHLQATGALPTDLAQATQGLDPDLAATIRSLVSGSALAPPQPNFTDILEWLLWPGVTLMVVSSLVAFGLSWRSIVRSFFGGKAAGQSTPTEDGGDVSRQWFVGGLIVALVISVALQLWLFEIIWYAAILGVLLSFVLAVVASRVSGETNVTPVGAMGKVTQLAFGLLVPNNPAANLMTANVTGGAASQCADLMHDFKCGHLLGATARKQAVGQVGGALAGSMLGSLFYLILIPDPRSMLLTPEWPAPAVATWKAVADLFAIGLEALPAGTPLAMLVAGTIGVILPVLNRVAPAAIKWWLPSASALGLAFVITGRNSISMFIGAALAMVLAKLLPRWSDRFVVVIASGLVAGESLTGAGDAVRLVLFGAAGP